MENFDWNAYAELPINLLLIFVLVRGLTAMRRFNDRILALLEKCLETRRDGDSPAS